MFLVQYLNRSLFLGTVKTPILRTMATKAPTTSVAEETTIINDLGRYINNLERALKTAESELDNDGEVSVVTTSSIEDHVVRTIQVLVRSIVSS